MEREKVDRAALGYDYKSQTEKHQSQKGEFMSSAAQNFITSCLTISCCVFFVFLPDYSKGFGGKYGVEKDKVDQAALGYDYRGETEKHQSQKGEFQSKLWHQI